MKLIFYSFLFLSLSLSANEKLLKPAEVFSHSRHLMYRPIFDNDFDSTMYLDKNIWLNTLSILMLQKQKEEAHKLLKENCEKAWSFRLDYALSALISFKDLELFNKEVERLSKMRANTSMLIDLARLHLLSKNPQKAIVHLESAKEKAVTLRDHLEIIYLFNLSGAKAKAVEVLKAALDSNFGGIPISSEENVTLKLWEYLYIKQSKGIEKFFIKSISNENIWEVEEIFIIFKKLLRKDIFEQALLERLKVDITFAYIVVDNVKLWDLEGKSLKNFISKAVEISKNSEDPLDSKDLYKLSKRDYSVDEENIGPENKVGTYLEMALTESRRGNHDKAKTALNKLSPANFEVEDDFLMMARTYLNLGEKEKAQNLLKQIKELDEYFAPILHSSHPEVINFLLQFFPPNSKENLKNRIFLYHQLKNKQMVHTCIKKLFDFSNGHEFSDTFDIALRMAFTETQLIGIINDLSNSNPLLSMDLLLKFNQTKKALDLSNKLLKQINTQEELTQLYIKVYRLKLKEALPAIIEKGIALARKEKSGVLFRFTHAAEIYNELGNKEKAQAYMIAAEAHEPLSGHDYLRIAYVYAKSFENIAKAKKFIAKVNPDELMFHSFYTNYAECLAIIGEKEKALKYFDLAISKVQFPAEAERIKAIKEKYFK